MAKFKLTKPYIKKLKAEIKNYNERIKYAEAKGLRVAPPKLTYEKVKSTISNKREYNMAIASMRRLTAKTLVDIGGITKYEQDEQIRIAKRARRRQLRTGNLVDSRRNYTIDASRTTSRMPTDRDFLLDELGIKPGFKGEIESKIEEWTTIPENMARVERWKLNYINRLNDIKFASPYSEELYEVLGNLEDLLMQMSLEDYVRGQLLNPAELSITSLYYPTDADAISLLSRIENAWRAVL